MRVSVWVCFRSVRGCFCVRCGIVCLWLGDVVGMVWGSFGMVCESCWDGLKIVFGSVRDPLGGVGGVFGHVLGMYWQVVTWNPKQIRKKSLFFPDHFSAVFRMPLFTPFGAQNASKMVPKSTKITPKATSALKNVISWNQCFYLMKSTIYKVWPTSKSSNISKTQQNTYKNKCLKQHMNFVRF